MPFVLNARAELMELTEAEVAVVTGAGSPTPNGAPSFGDTIRVSSYPSSGDLDHYDDDH